MRIAGWVLVAALLLLGLLTLDPARIGLSGTTPVLQAIALRGLCAAAAGTVALLLLLPAGAAALLRWRTVAAQVLVLAAGAAVVAGGHGAVLSGRGLDGGLGPEDPQAFEVLTLNTLDAAGGTDSIAALVDGSGAEVVALQETTAADAEAIAAQSGADFQVFTASAGVGSAGDTALLVDRDLGAYTQVDAPGTTFAAVRATPQEDGLPVLASVHPVPPMPGQEDTWRAEIEAVTALCEEVPGLVMAGDYNATRDHAVLREASCLDAAAEAGAAGAGTWPADRPRWQGAQIDHVLLDGEAWQVLGAQVLESPGGDHRPVLVRLAPA